MGRFFKTSDTDYSIDYGFNPDLKDIIPLVQNMQKTAEENAEALTLFGDIPVEYISDYDRENALGIKQEYEDARNTLASMDLSQPNAILKLQAGIRGLQSKLKKDVETGRIKRLADNKKYYDTRMEEINKMKDPYSREIARKVWEEEMRSNPYGSLDRRLNLGEMYEKRNLWEEFTKSGAFSALKADAKASGIDYVNGQWIDSKSGSVTQLSVAKIQQALKHFIEQEIPGYGQYMQKYGGERFYNEDGSIDWTSKNSEVKKLMDVAMTAAYKQTSSEHRKNVNPYAQMEYSHALSNRGGSGGGSSEEVIGSIQVPTGFLINKKDEAWEKIRDKLPKGLQESFDKYSNKDDLNGISNLILNTAGVSSEIRNLYKEYQKRNATGFLSINSDKYSSQFTGRTYTKDQISKQLVNLVKGGQEGRVLGKHGGKLKDNFTFEKALKQVEETSSVGEIEIVDASYTDEKGLHPAYHIIGYKKEEDGTKGLEVTSRTIYFNDISL